MLSELNNTLLCKFMISFKCIIVVTSCLQVPEERAHCVWLAAGSGLRSDIWKKFQTRFAIRTVREGYGLTETSISFLNYTDEVGPIGRASYFYKVSRKIVWT